MLRIRNDQIEHLRSTMEREFASRMAADLRRRFPAESADVTDAALCELMIEGARRAQRYRVLSEDDVRSFLECLVVHGADFDSRLAWAREILSSPHLSGGQKMDRILDYEIFSSGDSP